MSGTVRCLFLAEIHNAWLKRYVPSSVLQAVRALRNAPAALAVFLAAVAPVVYGLSKNHQWKSETWWWNGKWTQLYEISVHGSKPIALEEERFDG